MRVPTEADILDILDTGTWFEELDWVEEAQDIFRCTATQQWSSDIVLTLQGTVNKKDGSYKWILFFNSYRVLALDREGPLWQKHHNPDCTNVYGLHFHQWRDDVESAKYANPVTFPEESDPEAGLRWFLRKCNIRVREMPGPVPVTHRQGRLIGS